LILTFLSHNESGAIAALYAPLTVSDYAGVARANELVTSGVPLPREANITSINQLQIIDSEGSTIPTQFTVLSRWEGSAGDNTKSIKWVLLDFQANVPKDGTALYYLKDGGSGPPSTSLTVQEDSGKITVNTGKAKFQINKSYFNLFDYVWIDSHNDGQLDDLVVNQPGQGGLILKDRNGKEFRTIYEAPEEIVVEEQGPLRSVVKIRGVFKASDGKYFAPSISDTSDATKENLDSLGYKYTSSFKENKFSQPYPNSISYYNARIYFYNDKDYVRVFITLENNGANGRTNPEQYYAPMQVVYFDSVYMDLKTAMSTADVSSEDSSTNLGSSDTFTLYQDWNEDLQDDKKTTLETTFVNGPYYQVKRNSQQLSSGSTNPGWVDMNGNSKGLGFGMRHFWQNFPKKLVFSPSQIKIGLWPEEGYYPHCQAGDSCDDRYGDNYCTLGGRDAGVYLFDAGRHKTHEMVLRFYPGSQDGETKKLSQKAENPLMALGSSQWYTESKALGMISPSGLTSGDSEINEAMERFELLQSANLYEEDSENGRTILNIRISDPPHWETSKQGQFFGWMNFGDMIWSSHYPNALHYDWTYSMLLHYIRSGKRSFFDTGVGMAKHRYDVDQYHGERDHTDTGGEKYLNYLQFYESSGHADPAVNRYHPSKLSFNSHTWNEGLVLYYLLTGDRKSWEAAVENGKAALNYYGTGGLKSADTADCAIKETRHETWAMLNLINLYRVNGDPEYLRVAKNIAKNRMLTREQAAGGIGCFGGGGDDCESVTPGQWSLFFAYGIEPMINIHYETQDQELGQFLVRMADWARNDLLFGGDYDSEGKYRPLQMSDYWKPSDPDGSLGGWDSYIVKVVFLPDLFAYVYSLTGQNLYLDWARKTFKDSLFYYTVGGGNYVSPGFRSAISYIDTMFPNSHTKVHGWLGRANQVYLFTEWQLQRGDRPGAPTGLRVIQNK